MSTLPPQEDLRTLCKRIQSSNYLLNKQLQHICSLNGLRSGGVKAELQRRLVDALTGAYTAGDAETYREIEQSVYREKNTSQAPARGGYAAPSAAHLPHETAAMNHSYSGGYHPSNGHHSYGGGYGASNGQRAQLAPPQGPTFRSSPFYHPIERLGNVHICEMMASHRNSLSIIIQAQDNPFLTQCVNDPSLRVMVFCAAANYGVQDIAFPHQSELKVNGDDVKANLRGLKNKPGSTRPVDITDLLRLKIRNYRNTVEFTYALTQKAGDKASFSQRFYLVILICRSVPIDSLVRNIEARKITKEAVVKELTTKAHDADIELSSQVMSLKCPLSYMRLDTPVRATTCTHVQCFDATSYLQLQQQGPQWLCPVCSKSAPFDRLAIDQYVQDILKRTSKSTEKVDIEPDGQWKAHRSEDEDVKPEPEYDAFDLDDDDLVVSEVNTVGNRSTNTPSGLGPSTGASISANGASREGSSMPRSGGTKRTHDVIDLTLSDDDDEPSQPPQKRQQLSRPGPVVPSYF